MRWSLLAVAAACGVALAAQRAGAQGGRHAALVLELPASSRALALGGAAAALAEDDASLFSNPAQLASSLGASGSLSLQQYLQSSTLAALSVAIPAGHGTAGFGVQLLDYGSEAEIVPDPAFGGERGLATGGQVSASDLAVTAGYGMSLGRVRLGASTKLVQQRIAGLTGSAGAVDIGAAVDAPYGLTLAASVQHIGSTLSIAGERAPLPRTIRFGGALALPRTGPLSMLATGEMRQIPGSGVRLGGGAEGNWSTGNGVVLTARLGVQDRPEGSAANRLTIGGGVRGGHVGLDYAYQGYETVGGAAHRVGARWWR